MINPPMSLNCGALIVCVCVYIYTHIYRDHRGDDTTKSAGPGISKYTHKGVVGSLIPNCSDPHIGGCKVQPCWLHSKVTTRREMYLGQSA